MGIGDCSVFVVNLKVLPIFQNMNACTLDEALQYLILSSLFEIIQMKWK